MTLDSSLLSSLYIGCLQDGTEIHRWAKEWETPKMRSDLHAGFDLSEGFGPVVVRARSLAHKPRTAEKSSGSLFIPYLLQVKASSVDKSVSLSVSYFLADQSNLATSPPGTIKTNQTCDQTTERPVNLARPAAPTALFNSTWPAAPHGLASIPKAGGVRQNLDLHREPGSNILR